MSQSLLYKEALGVLGNAGISFHAEIGLLFENICRIEEKLRHPPLHLWGMVFKDLDAACKFRNVSVECYEERMAMGWSLDESFGVVPRNDKSVTYNGTRYENVTDMLNSLKILVPEQYFNDTCRYEYNGDIEQTVDRFLCRSTKEAKPKTANKASKPAAKKGFPIKITCDGIEFDSYSKWAKHYNMNIATLRYRLNTGMTPEAAVSAPTKSDEKSPAHFAKPVVYNGKNYPSMTAFCKKTGVAMADLKEAMATKGVPLQKALSGILSKKNQDKHWVVAESGKIFFNNVWFDDHEALCKAYDVSPSLFKQRQAEGWPTLDILAMIPDRSKDMSDPTKNNREDTHNKWF